MAANSGNGAAIRSSVVETARQKMRRRAEEGRTLEQIDRALVGEGLTELERDVLQLLARFEVRGGSRARVGTGYWQDIDREIGA